MKILSIFLFLFCFVSCQQKFNANLSGIELKVEIKRLDKDFFNIPADSISYYMSGLDQKYGEFFKLYTEGVIGIGNFNNPNFPALYNRFCTDKSIIEAKSAVDELFTDIDELSQEIELALKYYNYYFPNKYVPQVYTCVSGFNQSILIGDSLIGICLDKYLGADCKLYTQLGFSNYQKKRMTKEMIIVDFVNALGYSEFAFNDSIDNLLSNMIYHGRNMYFVDAILPGVEDSLKWGYTADQVYWSEKNEKNIWGFFVEHKLLFSSDRTDIAKYVNDAPFTSTFTSNSAPRTGIYIGRKIVGSFMKHNKNYNLNQLMEITDYQYILNKSAYNP